MSDRSRIMRIVAKRRARATTRAKLTTAARRAHAAQEPRGPMLRYLRGLRAFNAGIHEAIARVFDRNMLAQISTAKMDAVGPPIIRRKIDDLRISLAERTTPRAVLPLIDQTARDVSKHNGKEMKRLLGIDVTKRDVGLGPVIDKFREDNVSLISSIVEDQLIDVEAMLIKHAGMRVEELADALQERFAVSDSRAALIARDQTLKLNGQITKTRQQSVGVEAYIWSTSNDERVREDHAALEGTRQLWAVEPPPGHPGMDYSCRCTAFPEIPELEEPDV